MNPTRWPRWSESKARFTQQYFLDVQPHLLRTQRPTFWRPAMIGNEHVVFPMWCRVAAMNMLLHAEFMAGHSIQVNTEVPKKYTRTLIF
jgi:hypothetical protein